MFPSRPRSAVAVAVAALGIAVLGGASTARAQLVPRLVDYPVVHVSSCRADAQSATAARRTLVSNGSKVVARVDVYSDAACSPSALLFTLTIEGAVPLRDDATRTITPTQRGIAFLGARCGAIEWKPETPQRVTPAECVFPAP